MVKEKCSCGDGDCCCGGKWIAVLVVLVAALLLAVAFTAGTIYAKDSNIVISSDGTNLNAKTLDVSGSVVKYVAPDKVDIVLSVSTLDKSAQKSQSDNATIADKVNTTLSSLSSVRAVVKTLAFSENEEFQYDDLTKKSESVGYRTINQIQVTLTGSDIERAGSIIDLAIQSGANSVSSISFSLTDAKELEIRKSALSEAAFVAKTKAQSIADGLGISFGKVHSVSESSFYYTPNYKSFDSTMASGAVSQATTPITAGDVEVSASVSVNFEIN
ncbi:MAG: SIMPL domain-containing protein [archaeon]